MSTTHVRAHALEVELPPRWDNAACADETIDPEIFHPISRYDPAAEAKTVCYHCPVIDECRAWANEHPNLAGDGVWGGKTARERHFTSRRAAACGTNAGYYRHLRLNEYVCSDCATAMAAHGRRYRASRADQPNPKENNHP